MGDLNLRMQALERECMRARRLNRLLACGVVLALVVGGVSVRASSPPVLIEAQRFVLVDAAGTKRATLGVFGDSVGLGLLTADGNARAMLQVANDGSQAALEVAGGNGRTARVLASANTSGFALTDMTGKTVGGFSVEGTGGPAIVLNDRLIK